MGGGDYCLRMGAESGSMERNFPRERGPMAHDRKQHGFTFIEIIIVVAMALTLAGFAVPQFMQALRNFRISGDARDLHGEILLAKMRAAANFTAARVKFDLTNRTFVSQMWCKAVVAPCTAANVWRNVNVGGPQPLASGISFGVANQTLHPPSTQPALAQAPTCKQGQAGGVPWAPGAGADEPGTTYCIMFNSRGFPVGNSGAATGSNAIYITDGAAVQGVTVSVTGLTATLRHDGTDTDAAHWYRH